ncbi:MAG: ATP synthase F1 subunit epsilon [Ottowia sp.]
MPFSEPPSSPAATAGFHLRVSTLNQLLFEGTVREVNIPGVEGRLGVRKGHAPLLTALAPGALTLHPTDGPAQTLAVAGGIVEIGPWGVTVLADFAGRDAEAEARRMKEARQRASVHVPYAQRPIGAQAVREELDAELLRFFSVAMRKKPPR